MLHGLALMRIDLQADAQGGFGWFVLVRAFQHTGGLVERHGLVLESRTGELVQPPGQAVPGNDRLRVVAQALVDAAEIDIDAVEVRIDLKGAFHDLARPVKVAVVGQDDAEVEQKGVEQGMVGGLRHEGFIERHGCRAMAARFQRLRRLDKFHDAHAAGGGRDVCGVRHGQSAFRKSVTHFSE